MKNLFSLLGCMGFFVSLRMTALRSAKRGAGVGVRYNVAERYAPDVV